MSAPALSYEDVSKTYVRSHLGRTHASRGLEGLSLELKTGEIFGLLGLNGSGKTTTMKLALGLIAPTRGSVKVFGGEAGSPETLSRTGYLPELPYFYPQLTPREVLAFYGRLSGLDPQALPGRVGRALERVGLRSHGERRMVEFSKGMLQRVGMAQALLHDPRLLLLDEPVSGLDPLAVAEFRALFAGLRKDGRTLLLCSHSISEVERLCDRAGILVEGRLVRVLGQDEWARSPGKLEELFVETVKGS